MSRLIDADAFDRRLAAAEFDAALNNADDESRPFREQTTYYSTDSFRAVMSYQPTIDAIPVEWIENMLKEWQKSRESFETCGAISAMLVRWQKEQEAQDG